MGTESDDKLKLYVRLPTKIKEELQIRDLHPDIAQVWLPRQKQRWCIVGFASVELLEGALKDLKGKRVDGKRIFVGPFRKGERRPPRKRHLLETDHSGRDRVSVRSLLELLKKEEEEEDDRQ